jgi:hypothetical protein
VGRAFDEASSLTTAPAAVVLRTTPRADRARSERPLLRERPGLIECTNIRLLNGTCVATRHNDEPMGRHRRARESDRSRRGRRGGRWLRALVERLAERRFAPGDRGRPVRHSRASDGSCRRPGVRPDHTKLQRSIGEPAAALDQLAGSAPGSLPGDGRAGGIRCHRRSWPGSGATLGATSVGPLPDRCRDDDAALGLDIDAVCAEVGGYRDGLVVAPYLAELATRSSCEFIGVVHAESCELVADRDNRDIS